MILKNICSNHPASILNQQTLDSTARHSDGA